MILIRFHFLFLGEYPSFTNGVTLKTDDTIVQVQQTTVNPMPVIWGPRRN